jgi:hypothetical protein
VGVDHSIIAKMFEEDVNNPLKGEVERQLANIKIKNPLGIAIVKFFVVKKSLDGSYVTKKKS